MARFLALPISFMFLGFHVFAQTPSPQGADVYFITPEDGAVTKSPLIVRFGLADMGIAPAGVDIPNTGHHHLLINSKLPTLDRPIPKDENHRHFGGGQTETRLMLAPGIYTLQLILGDYRHIPHDSPVISEKITITVEE
ncbi:MAG: DUF4399 domain-containing protein [Gammaproteobacteria bacterium]